MNHNVHHNSSSSENEMGNVSRTCLNSKIFVVIGPILLFPLFIISELLSINGILKNILINIINGFYFLFILPLYPIFLYIIMKYNKVDDNDHYFIEKLSYLIGLNISILILYAAFNILIINYLSFNGLFIFIISLFLLNLSIMLIMLYRDLKKKTIDHNNINSKNQTFINYTRSIINLLNERSITLRIMPKNFGLLFIFGILVGLFVVLKYPVLFGDDPWFHLAIIKVMLQEHSFMAPFNHYYGLFGFFSIGAFFQLISNLSLLELGRVFPVIITVLIVLVGFDVTKIFIKNDQFAILGALLFLITPFDFALVYGQFWPSSLVILLGLLWFSIIFKFRIRIEKYNSQKYNLSYIIMALLLEVSLFFIHDFTAIVLSIGALFVFIIQTLRNYKKNFIILFYILLGIMIAIILKVLIGNSPISRYIFSLLNFNIILKPLILVAAIFGILLINRIINYPLDAIKREELIHGQKNPIIKRILKVILLYNFPNISIKFKRNLKSADEEQTSKKDKKITDFLFTPRFLKILLISSLIIALGIYMSSPKVINENKDYLLVYSINSLLGINILILGLAALITLQIRNFKNDILFFWEIYFLLIISGLFILKVVIHFYDFWIRILIDSSGIISFSLILYIKLMIKRNTLKIRNLKLIIYIFFIALLINFNIYKYSNNWYNNSSEVNTIQTFVDNIPQNNTILSDFRWDYPIKFYSAFNDSIYWQKGWILLSKNQTDPSGVNLLNELKNKSNNIYFILNYKQFDRGIMAKNSIYYGHLNQTDLIYYYESGSFDKILSLKDINHKMISYIFYMI